MLGRSMLPHAIPTATAALICGLSARSFRHRVLEPGLVEREGTKIVVASLAGHLGEPITNERYLAADRCRDAARHWQRSAGMRY